MNKSKLLILGVFTALAAYADPVTWTLQNVTLKCVGPCQYTFVPPIINITGSFTYDVNAGATGTYSNWNLQVSNSYQGQVDHTYTPADSTLGYASSGLLQVVIPGVSELVLIYYPYLTNGGGTVPLVQSSGPFEAGTFDLQNPFTPYALNSGSLTAPPPPIPTPEPQRAGLLLSAVIGLWSVRKLTSARMSG